MNLDFIINENRVHLWPINLNWCNFIACKIDVEDGWDLCEIELYGIGSKIVSPFCESHGEVITYILYNLWSIDVILLISELTLISLAIFHNLAEIK